MNLPDNEFTSQFLDDMPSADSAYSAELKYYKKIWCECGAYILIKTDDPKPLYQCKCGKYHNLLNISPTLQYLQSAINTPFLVRFLYSVNITIHKSFLDT